MRKQRSHFHINVSREKNKTAKEKPPWGFGSGCLWIHTAFSKASKRFRACPAAWNRLGFLTHSGSCPCSWAVQPLKVDYRGSTEDHAHALGVYSLSKGSFNFYTQTFCGHAFSRNLLSHLRCWRPCIPPPRIFMCCLMPKTTVLFHFLEESADLEKFHPYSITAEIFHKDIKNDKQVQWR